jgi:hypothetical protein
MVRICGSVITCQECDRFLMLRGMFGGSDGDWCMLKNRTWRAVTADTDARFLCVKCIEGRIGRRLNAADFRRSAKVNFMGTKSALLRKRMKGLMPAKRLRETTFTWHR